MSILAVAATAAIEFVGLIMINTQSPVRALIPKVPLPQQGSSIPNHAAIIAFPKAAVISNHWTQQSQDLGADTNYAKIDLNHDTVVFDTLGTPNNSTFGNTASLTLPKLNQAATDLNLHFKPTTNFDWAAAIIELPSGTLSACHGKTNRIDALLRLNTNGNLVIRTTTGSKYVILDTTLLGEARIYVANAPTDYINQGDAHGQLKNHWPIYYAMTNLPGGTDEPRAPGPVNETCVAPALTAGNGNGGNGGNGGNTMQNASMAQNAAAFRISSPQRSFEPAPAARRMEPAHQSSQRGDPVDTYITTAECGSTQWP